MMEIGSIREFVNSAYKRRWTESRIITLKYSLTPYSREARTRDFVDAI